MRHPAAGAPQEALRRRITETLLRAVDTLPDDVVADALAAASPLESAALVLGGAAAPELGQATPWTRALLRGAGLKAEIARAAGGLLRTGEVAELLGISPQAVQQRRTRGTLLALPTAQGDWGYPALQFDEIQGVRAGVQAVLAANPGMDPWERLAILTEGAEGGAETLLERLDDPDTTRRACRLIESFGTHEAV